VWFVFPARGYFERKFLKFENALGISTNAHSYVSISSASILVFHNFNLLKQRAEEASLTPIPCTIKKCRLSLLFFLSSIYPATEYLPFRPVCVHPIPGLYVSCRAEQVDGRNLWWHQWS
jgi:hypothetical protein